MIEIDLVLDDLTSEFPGLDTSAPLRILQGDALEQLRILPAQSVQCCVTSPPYWGLRDYGTAEWEGGDAGCDHKRFNGYPSGLEGSKESTYNGKFEKLVCGKCGARRIDSQLGLEQTPEEYIANMVAVFKEVWRVLRDDGTLWLNMGDSYASGGAQTTGYNEPDWIKSFGGKISGKCNGGPRKSVGQSGLKPKDLCMMPARLAMALQADGWYLRSEIIWHKPNPMPESVTDRPTKAHEMIYLLAKRPSYFYDAEAIREPVIPDPRDALWEVSEKGSYFENRDERAERGMMMKKRDSFVRMSNPAGRNKRTVWTIATQPYAEAHFATFPEEIPKLCILAGSKPGDTILDPFAGSGTVGKLALELGRKAVLIELNPKYVQLIEDRTRITIGMF
jgi:DNA modification methylase